MHEYVDVGCAPTDESCAQVGSPDYYPRARRECRAYIAQLRRMFGPEPHGAVLTLRNNPHDFGTYLSVICYHETGDQTAIDYALRCENESPAEWDSVARHELTDEKGASNG